VTRNTIVVQSPGSRNSVEFTGEGLAWGTDPKQIEWTGFDRVTLVTESGRSLHIDVAPDAFEAGATLPSPADKLARKARLLIHEPAALSSTADKNRRELKSSHNLWISFFWPNPLTPYGAGLWFRLQIKVESNGPKKGFLKIAREVAPQGEYGTRLWYLRDKEESRWKQVDHLLNGQTTEHALLFDDFASIRHDLAERGAGGDLEALEIERPGFLLGDSWADDSPPASLAECKARGLIYSVGTPDPSAKALILGTEARTPLRDAKKASPPFLLNPRAFGEGEAALPRSQLFATALDLRCVGQSRTEAGTGDERTWILDWTGIPMAPPAKGRDALTVPRLWHFLSLHYPVGLGAVRARNRFSLLPTQIVGRVDASPATMRFELVTGTDLSGRRLQMRQIGLGTQTLKLRLGAAQRADGGATELTCTVADDFNHSGGSTAQAFRPIQAAASEAEPFARDLISFSGKVAAGSAPAANNPDQLDLILGGVRARAKKLSTVRMQVALHPPTAIGEQRPIAVDLSYGFIEATLVPASQDPEPGFETLAGWLDRPRPIAVVLDDSSARPLTLEAHEKASAAASRTVRIVARNGKPKEAVDFISDVAVIDPAPLTIARVNDTVKIEGGGTVAVYLDDSESSPGWEFTDRDGRMEIVLPPQVVGEEMIKGRLRLPDGREVPFVRKNGDTVEHEPFDYRLGANAMLTVDRTDIDTARTAPPWMLRRYLNRRTGVTGLKLIEARFELVYGLNTQVKAPGLRVGELDALIGRIPLPDTMVRLGRDWKALNGGGQVRTEAKPSIETVERRYSYDQGVWISDLFKRLSWWPLFRDAADRRQLKIAEDVSVSLRKARQTAHPFQIGAFHDGSDPNADERKPLRGGVDWVFQSPNIYREFTDDPNSVEALVEGVAFGPLGARGAQSASYANGKTIIISRTDQGHLESLVLMRIGRIGMLWNHARHVIVYQRSSRRAPRYGLGDDPFPGDTYDEQTAHFEGFMALRKVREYVEITQPRRSYPDFDDRLPFAGPIRQSTFETAVIPIKASWAQDVDQGQIIPLHGPVRSDAERGFFPRPKIFVEMARAAEKGGGLIASEVENPSQLFFFTSTRPKDEGNTDIWPAWPDVDFPLIRIEKPPLVAAQPSFAGARHQPDAARADFGQRRFTIDLIPNAEAVNLMHGRQPNALEAKVMAVSLARGRAEVKPSKLVESFADASANLVDSLAELKLHADRYLSEKIDTASAKHRQFIVDAQRFASRIAGQKDVILNQLKGVEIQAQGWAARQREQVELYNKSLVAELGALSDDLKRTADGLADDAQAAARGALHNAMLLAEQRLASLSYLPARALETLDRAIADIERQFLDRLRATGRELRGDLEALEGTYKQNSSHAAALEATWRTRYADLLSALRRTTDDLPRILDGLLGDLFSGSALGDPTLVNTVRQEFIRAVETRLNEKLKKALKSLSDIPGFTSAKPSWTTISDIYQEFEKLEASWLSDALRGVLKPFRESAETLVSAWTKELEARQDSLRSRAATLLKEIDTDAKQALANASATLEAWAKDNASELTGWVEDELKTLAENDELNGWVGAADAVASFEKIFSADDNPLSELQKLLNPTATVEELKSAFATAVGDLRRGFDDAAREVERSITSTLRKEAADLLDSAAGPALELGRALATGIETDTLQCTRDALGYYYSRASHLDVTRASAILNDLGEGNLNALSAMVPFDKIRERLLPQLKDLDLSSIFPDFAGLKLEHLFPELKIVEDELGEYDWLKIKHGFDKERLTAWSDVSIDKLFDEPVTLLAIPPVSLTLGNARLRAHCRMEVGQSGARTQDMSGSILADWTLNLSGKPLVIMQRAELVFGNDGKFDFKFESENLVLADELKFITEAVKNLLPQEEGLTITPSLPAGIKAELALPLPDLGTGAFTLTGVTLFSHLGLSIAKDFTITTGFWLSRPERPFGLAVLFLGGGGWVGADISYTPPGTFDTRISIGISAGAFIALNFGFARASAGLLFTAGAEFRRISGPGGSSGSTAVSLGLVIWGDFSILSIANAYLRITAQVTYTDDDGMVANGRVQVKIRISYFYTLKVNRSFTREFRKGKGGSGGQNVYMLGNTAALLENSPALALAAISEAVRLHYETLDLQA
jgi:hypothetical protein